MSYEMKRIFAACGVLLVIFLVVESVSYFSHREQQYTVSPISPILKGVATSTDAYTYQDEGDYYSIDVRYPAVVPLPHDAAVKAELYMEQAVADDVEDFKKDFGPGTITPHDIEVMGFGVGGDHYGQKYEYETTYTAHQSGDKVSYEFDTYEYTLGAHGNTRYKTFTFDPQGNVLELSDLFTPHSSYLQRVSGLAYQGVIDQFAGQEGYEEDSVDTDWVRDGTTLTATTSQDYYLDGNSLHLLYPPYAVAPYVAGGFDIAIPLSKLQDILK